METPTASDFQISPMRVLTLPPISFFYVTNQPTAFSNLDRDLDPLLDSLYAAKKLAQLGEMGPDIVRYYRAEPGEVDLFRMEVGIAVNPEVRPAGEALVKPLEEYPCAGILLWGGLTHIVQAYETLTREMQAAGIKHTGECREVTYSFESPVSPNNLMGIYMGLGPSG